MQYLGVENEEVVNLNIDSIHSFKNHPFLVRDDKDR